jgi:AcrR family transcriptional regulator
MSDSTTPRERRAERTRQAILDATMQLIVEKGPDNLSLREVARRIDYSPAGLYEYFDGKDELVEAACREADLRLSTYLRAVPEDLPVEKYLLETGLAYVRFARENPEHFMFLFSNRETSFDALFPEGKTDITPDKDWTKDDPNFGILYHAVLRAIERGVVVTRPDYGPLEIAYTLWAMAHGLATLQASYQHEFPVDYAVADRHALRLTIAGLGQPPD